MITLYSRLIFQTTMNVKTVSIPVTRFVAILQEATIVFAGQDTILMVTYGLAKVSHPH